MVTTVSLVHCVFYEQVRYISHCTGKMDGCISPIILEIVHVKQTHFSSNY